MAMDLGTFGTPYWLDLVRPAYPSLDRDVTCDAVVIGAGIAGLKIARLLGRLGKRTIVIDAGRVGEGASGRNQGSINHGAAMSYRDCAAKHSRDVARRLWTLGLENHRLLKAQIDEYQIDCDYQIDGMTSLVRRDQPNFEQLADAYQAEFQWLQEDGFDVSFLNERESGEAGGNSSLYVAGLRYNTDAQFHSGKYAIGLAAGIARDENIEIFERTRVQSIASAGSTTVVGTAAHSIHAAQVFLSTNALVPQFVPSLATALRAERGQVLVTEPMPRRPCRGSFGTWMAWWREILEPDGCFRLLFGGGRERDEPDSLFAQYEPDGRPSAKLEFEGFRPSLAHQRRLDEQFSILFPELRGVGVTHRWGGLQSFTADSLPQMGLIDADRRIYAMAGFCGRGNCHSDVGAELLVARACGVTSPLVETYGELMDQLMNVGRVEADWTGG